MKLQIESKELQQIARQSEDALCIAQEFAKGHGQELKKLSETMETLMMKSFNPSDLDLKKLSNIEARLEKLEIQFSSLHALLVEKTPTGKEKPTATAKRMIKFFPRS